MHSKLGGVTVPIVGKGTTVGGNSEKFLLTDPMFGTRRLQYGDALPTKPQKHGWISHLPTDTTVDALRYAPSYSI